MKRELSAGGVLFREHEVLLIKNPSGVWSFPKGHIEEGERPEQTAVREVLEETGVEGKVVDYLGEISYWYSLQGERVFKRVKFFLMSYVRGEPKASWEVLEAEFFSYREVPKLLKYEGDKRIFKRALSKLSLSAP